VLIAAMVATLALVMLALTQDTPAGRLTEVYTPSFRRLPATAPLRHTVAVLWSDLKQPAGHQVLRRMLPSQGGVLWLSLVILVATAFDFDRLRNPRNLDLLILQALAMSMFEITRFLRLLTDPVYVRLMDWVFVGIFALNIALIGRALWRVVVPEAAAWRPTLPIRPLIAVALLLMACNVTAALVREPDDVGFFVNLGAQRLRERHRLPYGDPLLSGSAGAAYGPLLYVAHLPFQFVLAPHRVKIESPDRPALGAAGTYQLPPELATKLCAIAFHLLGVWALFVATRRLAGVEVAWGLVALYCGSAFVLGIGGEEFYIGGMTYISHIAPTAMTLAALALLPNALWSGIVLALAAGVGFYPAFMAPAWLGYYWNDRRARNRFVAAFVAVCAVVGVGVLLLSRADAGRGLLATILFDTFGHHTDPNHYGRSPFSFWGQRAGIRGWLNAPLVGASGFSTPFFLVFVIVVALSFGFARRRSPQQLALIAAAVALGSSLIKIHPTGTYVVWAYPLLLIGFFAPRTAIASAHSDASGHLKPVSDAGPVGWWRRWQRVAHKAAEVQSEVVLSALYVLVVPFAWVARIGGRSRAPRSGWRARPAREQGLAESRRQF
jgi:hypothetical protein